MGFLSKHYAALVAAPSIDEAFSDASNNSSFGGGMHANMVLAFGLLAIVGCAREQADSLSPQQKEQMKLEVQAATDSIISRWAALDVAGGLTYYSDSPDWVWFGPGGTRYDFKAFKKLWTEVNQSTASLKVTTVHEEFKVIARTVVICVWEGKDENIMKSGDTLIYDPHAITFVFTKIADQWKVTYTHESGIPVKHNASGQR